MNRYWWSTAYVIVSFSQNWGLGCFLLLCAFQPKYLLHTDLYYVLELLVSSLNNYKGICNIFPDRVLPVISSYWCSFLDLIRCSSICAHCVCFLLIRATFYLISYFTSQLFVPLFRHSAGKMNCICLKQPREKERGWSRWAFLFGTVVHLIWFRLYFT